MASSRLSGAPPALDLMQGPRSSYSSSKAETPKAAGAASRPVGKPAPPAPQQPWASGVHQADLSEASRKVLAAGMGEWTLQPANGLISVERETRPLISTLSPETLHSVFKLKHVHMLSLYRALHNHVESFHQEVQELSAGAERREELLQAIWAMHGQLWSELLGQRYCSEVDALLQELSAERAARQAAEAALAEERQRVAALQREGAAQAGRVQECEAAGVQAALAGRVAQDRAAELEGQVAALKGVQQQLTAKLASSGARAVQAHARVDLLEEELGEVKAALARRDAFTQELKATMDEQSGVMAAQAFRVSELQRALAAEQASLAQALATLAAKDDPAALAAQQARQEELRDALQDALQQLGQQKGVAAAAVAAAEEAKAAAASEVARVQGAEQALRAQVSELQGEVKVATAAALRAQEQCAAYKRTAAEEKDAAVRAASQQWQQRVQEEKERAAQLEANGVKQQGRIKDLTGQIWVLTHRLQVLTKQMQDLDPEGLGAALVQAREEMSAAVRRAQAAEEQVQALSELHGCSLTEHRLLAQRAARLQQAVVGLQQQLDASERLARLQQLEEEQKEAKEAALLAEQRELWLQQQLHAAWRAAKRQQAPPSKPQQEASASGEVQKASAQVEDPGDAGASRSGSTKLVTFADEASFRLEAQQPDAAAAAAEGGGETSGASRPNFAAAVTRVLGGREVWDGVPVARLKAVLFEQAQELDEARLEAAALAEELAGARQALHAELARCSELQVQLKGAEAEAGSTARWLQAVVQLARQLSRQLTALLRSDARYRAALAPFAAASNLMAAHGNGRADGDGAASAAGSGSADGEPSLSLPAGDPVGASEDEEGGGSGAEEELAMENLDLDDQAAMQLAVLSELGQLVAAASAAVGTAPAAVTVPSPQLVAVASSLEALVADVNRVVSWGSSVVAAGQQEPRQQGDDGGAEEGIREQ